MNEHHEPPVFLLNVPSSPACRVRINSNPVPATWESTWTIRNKDRAPSTIPTDQNMKVIFEDYSVIITQTYKKMVPLVLNFYGCYSNNNYVVHYLIAVKIRTSWDQHVDYYFLSFL